MDKITLNAQLFTTGLKRVFYHLKSVDCERSDLWKSFGLVVNEKNDQLDFVACYTLLDSGVMSRASFCNFFTVSEKRRINVVQCFKLVDRNSILQLFSFLHATFIK